MTAKQILGVAALVFAASALLFLMNNLGDAMDARDRLANRQRLITTICRERGGMPTFDKENFVIGCDR